MSYRWGGDPEDYNTGFMGSVFEALGRSTPVGRFQPRVVRERPAPLGDPLYRLLEEHRDIRDKYYLEDHLCSCDEMVEDHVAHLTEVVRTYLQENRHGSTARLRQSLRRLSDRALARIRLGKG